MKLIDPKLTPRARHFKHFRGYALPYTTLTAPVDITPLFTAAKQRGESLFLATLYAVTKATNTIPELRQRIRGEQIVEYQSVDPAFTILRSDDTIRFCPTPFSVDRAQFMSAATAIADAAKADNNPAPLEPHIDRDDLIFISAIPWVNFTSMQHPAQTHDDDSVPRIAWGKVVDQSGKKVMSLSVQVHHALVDGLHMGRFFEAVEREFRNDS